MSNLAEIDGAVDRIRDGGIPLVVLQCTTAYPCLPEKIGVNLISFFRERYDCSVGLSDHSGTIYPGLAAVALGIQMLEVHVTFSREMFGPDVPASITTAELKQLVEGIRFIEKMIENPVDKDEMAQNVHELRKAFMKSVVARRDLKAGRILTRDDLAAKKPGTGIPAARMPELIGRRLTCDLNQDSLLTEDVLE
jgi:N-acetylneuraminate synthase